MASKIQYGIGTSGWSYKHWKKTFYPEDLPMKNWLDFYARHFYCVEINNSFYHLPDKKTLRQWYERVPRKFIFTVKSSRYITHMKKLKDPKKSTYKFFHRISALDDKLGPILFQLPPRWAFNEDRLADFLRSLSEDYRYAFEFRDHSWINDRTCELLDKFKAAFCIYDLNGFQTDRIVTTDFVYIRLHGPRGAYQGNYSKRQLAAWEKHLRTWHKQRKAVYCFFDNDQAAYAAKNALCLQSLLE